MPNAPSKVAKESHGNAAVLVLADSRLSEYMQLPETMFAALSHFGVPYRVHDLAEKGLDREVLDNCSALIVGQENLGLSIDSEDRAMLLKAVEDGLGFVNFDYNLRNYDEPFRRAAGVKGSGHQGRFVVDSVDRLGIVTTDHFLTHTQENGATHALHMPIPGLRTRLAGDRAILAETGDGSPAVVAGTFGKGRVVQWLVSPRLWLLRFLGHAHGIDDLFWKGIVWVARKPFVMLAMPPYVRFRFDDCNGLYQRPEDLLFVDVLNEHGHKPNLCVCMNALEPEGWGRLKALYDAGRVEVAPHTWKGGVSLYYGDADGEYSDEVFRDLMRSTRAMLDRHGITPSKIMSDHEHEFSAKVLPYLSELGIEYKMNIMLAGERWAGPHTDWRPEPYGSMSYALDYTPGPYPLFVVFNHYIGFDYARAYVSQDTFLLNRDGGYGDCMWDFLNGLTSRALGHNDVDAMARRLAQHTRLGLNSLFFGGSISHSHFTQALTAQEWRVVLQRYEALTERFEKINVGYDEIAAYARSKFHTQVASASWHPIRQELEIELNGKAEVPLVLSVFEDAGDTVERRYEPIEAFSGQQTVSLSPARSVN